MSVSAGESGIVESAAPLVVTSPLHSTFASKSPEKKTTKLVVKKKKKGRRFFFTNRRTRKTRHVWIWICQRCKKPFATKADAVMHDKKDHVYPCLFCKKKFHMPCILRNHYGLKHSTGLPNCSVKLTRIEISFLPKSKPEEFVSAASTSTQTEVWLFSEKNKRMLGAEEFCVKVKGHIHPSLAQISEYESEEEVDEDEIVVEHPAHLGVQIPISQSIQNAVMSVPIPEDLEDDLEVGVVGNEEENVDVVAESLICGASRAAVVNNADDESEATSPNAEAEKSVEFVTALAFTQTGKDLDAGPDSDSDCDGLKREEQADHESGKDKVTDCNMDSEEEREGDGEKSEVSSPCKLKQGLYFQRSRRSAIQSLILVAAARFKQITTHQAAQPTNFLGKGAID